MHDVWWESHCFYLRLRKKWHCIIYQLRTSNKRSEILVTQNTQESRTTNILPGIIPEDNFFVNYNEGLHPLLQTISKIRMLHLNRVMKLNPGFKWDFILRHWQQQLKTAPARHQVDICDHFRRKLTDIIESIHPWWKSLHFPLAMTKMVVNNVFFKINVNKNIFIHTNTTFVIQEWQ